MNDATANSSSDEAVKKNSSNPCKRGDCERFENGLAASRKSIRLSFADVPDLPGWRSSSKRNGRTIQISPESPNFRLVEWLTSRYDVVFDHDKPDYIIFSVFGSNHLEFPEAIRIFFTGENVHPDFNLCDYSFGYDWLTFGDRHYRAPNYVLYEHFSDLCKRRYSRADHDLVNRRFCNFVYTNRAAHPFRDQFFHRLVHYRPVDSPGAHLNNMTQALGAAYHGNWSQQKVDFQKAYKFTIAFENSSTIGYTTEKIVHALAADTIPIYWGNPEVAREFNPRRFINCHDHPDVDSIIRKVQELDSDDELYLKTLSEPFFPGDRIPEDLQEEAIMRQFDMIFHQPKSTAARRNRYFWGKKYEDRARAQVRAGNFLQGCGLFSLPARLCYKLDTKLRKVFFSSE